MCAIDFTRAAQANTACMEGRMWQSSEARFTLCLNAADRRSIVPSLPNANIKGWIFFAFACAVDRSAIKRRRPVNPTLWARRVAGGPTRTPVEGACPSLSNSAPVHAFRLSSADSYLRTRSRSGSSRVTLVALRAIRCARNRRLCTCGEAPVNGAKTFALLPPTCWEDQRASPEGAQRGKRQSDSAYSRRCHRAHPPSHSRWRLYLKSFISFLWKRPQFPLQPPIGPDSFFCSPSFILLRTWICLRGSSPGLLLESLSSLSRASTMVNNAFVDWSN